MVFLAQSEWWVGKQTMWLVCKHGSAPPPSGSEAGQRAAARSVSMADTLNKVFGKGKKGEPPSPQQAIMKLRQTEEMLSKKSEHIETKIEKELAAAKKHGTKNKTGL